jgi:GNAT superfamily N-acetyltransferase
MRLDDGYHDLPRGKLAMVVTHLQMKARTPLRNVQQPEGTEFEPLPRDPGVYRDVMRRVGQDWLWFGRLELDDLALCAIIESEAVDIWTLRCDGRPEAILELDFRTPGECELAYFGVTPLLIGTGAGAWLMDRTIELAWAQDIARLHVHTCTLDSPQALEFYVRSGFTPYKRQIEIADDPRRRGLYPETAAPQIPLL